MRELVRTNNAVLVSAIGALLDGARIHYVVLDQNMSVLEGSLGILPRRMLVADEDVAPARRLLTDAGLAHELRPDDRLSATAAPAIDAVLGGRLRLRQPLKGHRVGHDAILLAAATGGRAGEQAVDLGAGVGAAGLALAARIDGLSGRAGRDRSRAGRRLPPVMRGSTQLEARVTALCADAESTRPWRRPGLAAGGVDRVLMNPPFRDPARQNVSPDPRRRPRACRRARIAATLGGERRHGCSSPAAC